MLAAVSRLFHVSSAANRDSILAPAGIWRHARTRPAFGDPEEISGDSLSRH